MSSIELTFQPVLQTEVKYFTSVRSKKEYALPKAPPDNSTVFIENKERHKIAIVVGEGDVFQGYPEKKYVLSDDADQWMFIYHAGHKKWIIAHKVMTQEPVISNSDLMKEIEKMRLENQALHKTVNELKSLQK